MTGWVYATTAEILRADQQTPTRSELAQRLPKADSRPMLDEAIRRKNEKSPGP